MRIVRIALMTAGLVLASAAPAQGKPPAPLTFEIDQQPLADALNAFSKQAGLQVIQRDEDVSTDGLVAPRLYGRLTPQQALKQLLANTGLKFEFINERTVRITSAAAERAQVDSSGAMAMQVAQADSSPPARQSASAAAGQGAQQSEEGGAAGAESKIGEVIVTATKRAENVQDVPISMAVVTAEDISRRGLVNSEDYLRGIPGVNQVESAAFGQAIVIRGMETTLVNQNFFTGATVATYFGETPTTGSYGIGGSNVDLKLVDIQRVEVLRGPQGTAFGSSSMGGAVRTIPVAPKLDRFEGKVGAGYSSTSGTGGENYMFQGVANIPLIEGKLALRGTAYRFDDSGFYRNRAGSDAAFQALVAQFGAQAFATDEQEVGGYSVTGGRLAALYQPTDTLKLTVSYITQKGVSDGFGQATSNTYEQTIMRVPPAQTIDGRVRGFAESKLDIVDAVLEYDLGWSDLLASYSHLDGGSEQAWPWSYIPTLVTPISLAGPSPYRSQVGEVRLATKFSGSWNFLVGLNYTDTPDNNRYLDYVWYGSPASNPYGQTLIATIDEWRDLKQKAAFGEVSWKFLSGWMLTGGARAYQYDRSSRTEQNGPLVGGSSITIIDSDASDVNFRANLSYKPMENALLYAGWAQGFRLGQPQAGVPASICDTDNDGFVDGSRVTVDSTRRVNSDSVDSYEIGAKLAVLDRRLVIDTAVFRMDWTGIPIQFSTGICPYGFTANAGAARSEGVEFQASYRITEAVRADFGTSWIDARLTKDAPGIGAFADDRLPGSPKFNANLGLQYGFAVAGHPAFVRADATHVGEFYGDLRQLANTRSGDYIKLDATARITLDKLNLDLYVRNLTNEDAFTFHGNLDYGPYFGYRLRPRTIGVQLDYSF